MPQEPVRDAVASQLDLCSQSDAVELIRQLLDRQRALRRQDQQIGLALEEAMARIAVRPHELPYNAMAVMRNIWPVIARESLSGFSSASSASSQHGLPTQYPRLVLRPWLPRDLGELRAAFPEQDPALVAGYRRRMWRSHVQRLYRDVGRDCPAGNWGHEDDGTLFLVQADGNFRYRTTRATFPLRNVPSSSVVCWVLPADAVVAAIVDFVDVPQYLLAWLTNRLKKQEGGHL